MRLKQSLSPKTFIRSHWYWTNLMIVSLVILLGACSSEKGVSVQNSEEPSVQDSEESSVVTETTPNTEADTDIKQEVEINSAPSVALEEIQFEEPEDVTWVQKEGVPSTLMAANEKLALFRSNSGYGLGLYYNYLRDNNRHSIALHSSKAAVCNDLETIIFVDEELPAGQQFVTNILKEHDAGLGDQREIYRGKHRENIDSLACHDKYIYYTIRNENDEKTSYAKVLTSYLTEVKPSEMEFSVPGTIGATDQNRNGVYVYLPSSQTLHLMNPNGATENDIELSTEDGISELYDFAINDENDWFIEYTNADGVGNFAINGKPIEIQTGYMYKYDWFDNRHLIFLNDGTLFLYDSETGERRELTTDAADFLAEGDEIYYETISSNQLLKLKRK